MRQSIGLLRSHPAAAALFAAALLAAACGCARSVNTPLIVDSIADLPHIREVYAGRLGELFPGISRESALEIFPEARPVAVREGVDAWEVALVQTFYLRGDPQSNLAFTEGLEHHALRFDRQSVWLYFKDDRLLAWDDPQTWPREADVKVEDWR